MLLKKEGMFLALTGEQSFKDKEDGKTIRYFEYYFKDEEMGQLLKLTSAEDFTAFDGLHVDIYVDVEKFGKNWSVKLGAINKSEDK